MTSSQQERPQGVRAFSLVEVLVAIALIAVLTGILLPAITKARETARRVACLSNVRQLAIAVTVYMADNRQYLPEAGSSNSALEAPLSPRARFAAAWTPIGNGRRVLPSIGGLLAPYAGTDGKVWRCPSAPEDSYSFKGPDPFWGHTSPNEFKPDYNYMAGKEFYDLASFGGPLVAQVKLREWAVRNVSGLHALRAIPVGQRADGVVVFHDRASTYHSKERRNIYTYGPDSDYYANYAYLDGHAEGHEYKNVNGYISTLHNPIRQSWFGADFTETFAEQYPPF